MFADEMVAVLDRFPDASLGEASPNVRRWSLFPFDRFEIESKADLGSDDRPDAWWLTDRWGGSRFGPFGGLFEVVHAVDVMQRMAQEAVPLLAGPGGVSVRTAPAGTVGNWEVWAVVDVSGALSPEADVAVCRHLAGWVSAGPGTDEFVDPVLRMNMVRFVASVCPGTDPMVLASMVDDALVAAGAGVQHPSMDDSGWVESRRLGEFPL